MFKCLKCGFFVKENNLTGSKNRNHCPICLYSRHLDLKIPGDRKSNCLGLMEPVELAFKKDGEIMLVHECQKCGSISKNRIAGDDDPKEILKIEDSKDLRTALYGNCTKDPGKLIIITGSTGSGKDTIVAELRKINPSWKQIVTSTTRPMRSNETQGVDYNFLDKETFKKMKDRGDFIETVEYAGNYYGTPKSAFDPLSKGETLIWRIEASMSSKVNNLFKNTIVIYIDLPDKETIYRRLKTRGMSEGEMEKRIKQDEHDRSKYHFENVIINSDGHLEETIQKVMEIIKT